MREFRTIRIALAAVLTAASVVAFQAGGAEASTASLPRSQVPAPSSQVAKRSSTGALAVRATHVGGAEVLQGRSKQVRTLIHNGTHYTVKGIKVDVVIPQSLSVSVQSRSWSCAGQRTSHMTCRLAAVLKAGAHHSFTMKVSAARDAVAGRRTITVVPSANEKPLIEADSIDVNIVDRGSAIIEPTLDYVSKSVSASGVALSTHTAYVGKEFTYKLKLDNIGHERLKPGERVNASQTIGNNVKIVSVSSKSGDKCVVLKKNWSCAITAKKTVQPGQNLDTVKVVLLPTKAAVRLAVGAVSVRTAGVKKAQKVTPVVGVEKPNDVVKIHIKSLHRTYAGGAMRVHARLENTSKSAVPAGHEVTVELPKGVAFTSAAGVSWKCGEPTTESPRTLKCTYGKSLSTGAVSTKLKVVAQLSSTIHASMKPLIVEFNSSVGHTSYKLYVGAAPAVKAVARLGQFSDGEYVIDLAGEALHEHKTPYGSQWVQRCTTVQDAKSAVCPSHLVVPKLELTNRKSVKAEAFVPARAKPTTYVFEYRAVTDSVSTSSIVTVKMPSSNVRGASSVSAQGSSSDSPVQIPGPRNSDSGGSGGSSTTSTTISPSNGSNQTTVPSTTTTTVSPSNGALQTTVTPTIPRSVTTALAAYGVVNTGLVTVSPQYSTVYNQVGELKGNVGHQFSAIGSVTTINYSLTDLTACAQASLDTSKMSFLGDKVSITDFVIVAPQTTQSNCTYRGITMTKGMVFFTFNIFGDNVAFNSVIDPNAFMGYLNLSTNVDTLDYPLAYTHVTFKKVSLTIRIDMALKTGGVLIGVDTDVFGTTLTLGGLLTLDGKTRQLTGDLVMAQTQTINFDGVAISNLMVGIGLTFNGPYSPATLNVVGSGKLQFMGATIDVREISFDFLGSEITSAKIDFALNTTLQNVYSLNGDFTFQWKAAPSPTKKNPTPQSTIEITSTVQFKANGFEIGSVGDPAMMTWTHACFTLRGKVIIPDVISVDVLGLYMLQDGFCDSSGATLSVGGMFSMIPRPGLAGDFRFDATNLDVNLPGIDVDGAFSFGQIFELPYSSIDLKFMFGTSVNGVAVDVKGEVDPIHGMDLTGDATVNVAGFPVSAKLEVKITPLVQKVSLKGVVDIAGVAVELRGTEEIDYVSIGHMDNFPFPHVELSGAMNFSPDGFDLGKVSFTLIESYALTGFTASADFTLGPLKSSGDLTFYVTDDDKVGFDIDTTGTLHLGSTDVDVQFKAGNCKSTVSTSSSSGGLSNINMGMGAMSGIGVASSTTASSSTTGSECGSLKTTSLKGKATFIIAGFSFTTDWFKFDVGGSFTSTVTTSDSKDDTPKDLKATFTYSINATISSSSPYFSTTEDASAEVWVRVDKKWDEVFSGSEGVSISLSPFKVSVKVSIKGIGSKSFSIS